MARGKLKPKPITGFGNPVDPEETEQTTVQPADQDDDRSTTEVAGQAARDQAEAAAREREAAEEEARQRRRRDEEAAARAEAEERARALKEARERAEREAREERERAEREARDRRAEENTADQDEETTRDDQEGDDERERRLRAAIKDDLLRLDLGHGDTLTIDLTKARQIQGSDNRQRNVQVPPRVATKVRKEANKSPDDTHVLVFFRALSKVIRYPREFGDYVTRYRKANAVSDPVLGIEIASGKRTRKNPVKLQYNPTLPFDELLIELAEQLKVSKAVFVSLTLVFYWDMDVELI